MNSPFVNIYFTKLFQDVANSIALQIEFKLPNSNEYARATLVIYKPNFLLRFGVIYDLPKDLPSNSFKLFLSEIIEKCKFYRVCYLEVRSTFNCEAYNSNLVSLRFKYKPWLNAFLFLDSNWQNRISRSKRRNIQKGIKKGLHFKVCQNYDEVADTYLLIHKHYRNIRKPLPNIDFFYNSFSNPKFSKVFCTYLDSRLVAASLVLLNEFNAAQFIFVAEKSNLNYTQAASFHQWSVLLWAYQNGYQHFDLVGGGEQNIAYGVREFKRRFGANFTEVGRWSFILIPVLWHSVYFLNNLVVAISKVSFKKP